MPSIRVSREVNTAMYFVTLTVKNWYYLFDRHHRFDILIHSLQYCQEHKELKIYAYVFMLNHIHLIIQSPDVAGFLRDFKRHSTKELIENIRKTEPPVLRLFEENNRKGARYNLAPARSAPASGSVVTPRYTIWQKTNLPKIIETADYFMQKKKYIEDNPVRKEYVAEPQHWVYSSAHESNVLKVEIDL